MKLRIGLLQMHVELGKPDVNYAHALELMEKAMKHEPDILVLPETWNVGFFPAEHLDELADKNGERTQEMLSTFAKNNNVNIVGGTVAAKIGNDILNRSYVFNREGKIAETFDKIHGFSLSGEPGYFRMGDHLAHFNLDGVACSMAVCYDIRFPEFARTMVLDGARMIFVPAAFNMTTGPAHWELTFRARALDNQIYMLGCAPARDTQAGYISWGHSIVTDSWGKVMKQLDEKEGILIEEIDLDREDQIREQLPLLKHRKSEMYHL